MNIASGCSILTSYYNEVDPYAAQWLRNLIAAGHIVRGDVDERSIVDVRADDLAGYDQCHFFAGIGGWTFALRIAGWPDNRPVWTGSCPCQPFSSAGAGKAADDERHLWPAWFSLIKECRPAIVFGEQVEAAIGWGWLDVVFADMEGQGYACGATVLPACSVGAPHIRQRMWFVADAGSGRHKPITGSVPTISREETTVGNDNIQPERSGATRELAHTASGGTATAQQPRQLCGLEQSRPNGQLVNTTSEQVGLPGRARQPRISHWSDADWLPCTDGKARPVRPGTFPLASGIPGRVGRLRAYGNAIVPQVAAEFISAFVECVGHDH